MSTTRISPFLSALVERKVEEHIPSVSLSPFLETLVMQAVNKRVDVLFEADEPDGHWVTVNGAHVFIKGASGAPTGRTLGKGQTTEAMWKDKAGNWDEARAAWHETVAERAVHGKQSSDHPQITIMGGGSASGKSTLGKQIVEHAADMVRVDSDELKLEIPEYADLKKTDPSNAAMRAHEESSHLAHMILAKSMANKLDIIYDTTSSGKNSSALVKEAADRGYKVNLIFADVPLSVARERANYRANNPNNRAGFGRVVPDEVIASSHHKSAENFMKMKEMPEVSSVRLFDTTEKTPSPIYSRSATDPGTIHDHARYAAYQKKARGE